MKNKVKNYFTFLKIYPEKQMNEKKQEKKTKKELLFMTPIDKSMTVDEIYLKLIKLLEKNGVKVKDSH